MKPPGNSDVGCAINTLLANEHYDFPRDVFDKRSSYAMRLVDAETQAGHSTPEYLNLVAAGLVARLEHISVTAYLGTPLNGTAAVAVRSAPCASSGSSWRRCCRWPRAAVPGHRRPLTGGLRSRPLLRRAPIGPKRSPLRSPGR